MSRSQGLLVATLLVATVLTFGCGDKTTEPLPGPYGSITLAAPSDTLVIGDTLAISATVIDTAGNPVPTPALTWRSTDRAVATVNGLGRVVGLREGTTVIQATGGGVTSKGIVLVVIQDFGWVDQTDAGLTVQNLNDVFFTNFLRGWVVGDLGTVLATVDAGLHWSDQSSRAMSTSYTLNSVFFLTASHGFIVGSLGRILESTDAGGHWTIRTGINTGLSELHDVYFVDGANGFIVGDNGVILRTKNAGLTWERSLPAITSANLRSVWATDVPGPNIVAWAVGDGGTIVGTRNGGDSWRIFEPFVTTQQLNAVVRRTTADAIAGGDLAAARTVADVDSAIWQLVPPPADIRDFRGLAWPTATAAFGVGEKLGGNTAIVLSIDGGLTWSNQDLAPGAPLSNTLRSVWFIDRNRGWAVGEQGLILHTATGGSQ